MNNLTPIERFLSAFKHQEVDRVPIFDAPNNPALFKEVLGRENFYSEGVPHVLLSKALGLDACMVPEGGYSGLISRNLEWTDSNHFKDELGVEYLCNDSSWPLGNPVSSPLADREAWCSLKLPDPGAHWRHEEIRNAIKEAHQGREDDIAVIAGVRSAFSVMYISMGLESLSINMYTDPDLIIEMAERISEFWMKSALISLEAGADAVFIANDMGFNANTIISPDDLRKFFFPSFFRQIKELKKAGGKVILHSCGNINAILEEIVDSGIDCYNNMQVAAGMDIEEVKKKYGDRIVLMGNVDATNIMTLPDPCEIEEAVKATISKAASGGGYILATDHSFHKGIPIENVYAFINAGKKWGKYPLKLS